MRDQYGQTARSDLNGRDKGVQAVAQAFGYTADDLSSIPAEANMGLSCGHPVALANLKPGETVVDLGSGGGLDVFLAAQKVGPAGKAIGIDMTSDMIHRAQVAARKGIDGKPLRNVEFHLATIDRLPLPDAKAHVHDHLRDLLSRYDVNDFAASVKVFVVKAPDFAVSKLAGKPRNLLRNAVASSTGVPLAQFSKICYHAWRRKISIVPTSARQ